MIKEAIILAGGLGTRLRDTVPDLPKCMAPVAGRPFLFYVINQLRMQGIEKIIFSLGYKHEYIQEYLQNQFSSLDYECIIESEPLGTGGALQLALKKITGANCVVTNGDTLFKTNLQAASVFHYRHAAECTLLLKPMKNFDRYGVVVLDNNNLVSSFSEKKFYTKGSVNGGMYILHVAAFLRKRFPDKFSFEKDYLEKFYPKKGIYGLMQDVYFIDIGVPEDYKKANNDLQQPLPDLKKANQDWTIFLDRDGVINYEKKEDYIKNTKEFRFYEGVKDAISILNHRFGKVFIVSNQRGVGRGLMTENDLTAIHEHMTAEIKKTGGRIDKIYYCTSTNNKDPHRKPNPGMLYHASLDFPEINLKQALMVGNKLSDMSFGKNAGVFTVFIATTNPETPFPHPDIDFRFDSLADFAKAL